MLMGGRSGVENERRPRTNDDRKKVPVKNAEFYHYLEEMHGIYMTGERHKIRAQNLSVREANKFALNEGDAALVVEGTGFTEVELPVWYQILYYRGARYELENEVHVGGGPARLAVRRRA
jgi:DNA-binding GntR family transcriptional regulator